MYEKLDDYKAPVMAGPRTVAVELLRVEDITFRMF